MSDLDSDEVLAIVIGAIIVVHLVIGIICGQIAAAKGRDPLLGFVTGALLDIFGLIIVMLMRPSVEAEARRRVEVERAYERQRSGRQSREDAEDYSVVTIKRSVDDSDSIQLPVAVLSNRDQRARGLGILARNPAAGGVYYCWPEGDNGPIAFRNNQHLDVCVLAINAEGVVEEILMLPSYGDADVSPTNPVASAIVVSRRRFESLEVEIGALVRLPDDLRSRLS